MENLPIEIVNSIEKYVSYKPENKNQLQEAVNLWCNHKSMALKKYGHISDWNTSLITNMKELFEEKKYFNENLNNWDVSNVINMDYMFLDALSFDKNNALWYKFYIKFKPETKDQLIEAVTLWYEYKELALDRYGHISCWNTSLITDMNYLFKENEDFNDYINSWDVSNVTSMIGMFEKASSFNQPLDSWDVSSVTDMNGMLLGAKSFNQALDSWDVSSVTDMNGMFYEASLFNQSLNSWNISSVINMANMFYDAYMFNKKNALWYEFVDYKIFKPKNKEELQEAVDFWCEHDYEGDSDSDSTTNSSSDDSWWTDEEYIPGRNYNKKFKSVKRTEREDNSDSISKEGKLYRNDAIDRFGHISLWDTSLITDMSYLFLDKEDFNDNITNWDVSSVTNMSGMFSGALDFNQPLHSWDISSVTNMDNMFWGVYSFNRDNAPWCEWYTDSFDP